MIKEFKFKEFLISEQQEVLAEKIGEVLSLVQTLLDDMENLGVKDKNLKAIEISNKLRPILKSDWKDQDEILKTLQAIAVVVEKTINEKGDLEELLPNVVEELQNIIEKLGSPINRLVPTDNITKSSKQVSEPISQTVSNTPNATQTASAEAPAQPKDIEIVDQGGNPNSAPGANQELGAVPLGGSSGPMLGI